MVLELAFVEQGDCEARVLPGDLQEEEAFLPVWTQRGDVLA